MRKSYPGITVTAARRVFGAFAVLWCSLALAAGAGVERLEVDQPRSFGYQIGDKLERIVHLTLHDPYRLDRDSLPARGRISPSLAIDEPLVHERRRAGTTEYDITLTYQIINVNPDISDIPVPHHAIFYRDGEEKSRILIPASRIGVSVLTGRTAGPELQADTAPRPLAAAPDGIIVLTAVLVLSLAGLVVLSRGLPFIGSKGPFVRAARRMNSIGRESWDDEIYADALQIVHRGFDETAGRTVFAERLEEFFRVNPAFEPLREPVAEFFGHSRAHFFGVSSTSARDRYSRAELIAFVRELRKLERGLA